MRRHIGTVSAALAIGLLCCVRSSLADFAPALTMTGYTFHAANAAHFTIGYTFTLSEPVTITALGAMDFGGTSIASTQSFPVKIYYSALTPAQGGSSENGNFSGQPVIGASALVSSTDPILAPDGSAYTSGDGFRYHTLDTPLTLAAATYEIQVSQFGTGYAAQATGLASVPGLNAPRLITFDGPDDNASYALSTNTAFMPGAFGPNFLVSVPEPGALALTALLGMTMVRRRTR